MKPPTYPARTSDQIPRTMGRGASLLEVLVALAVLAILASVLISTHICTVRREQASRTLEEARFIAERVRTESQLGFSVEEIMAGNPPGWGIAWDAAVGSGSNGGRQWLRWVIYPSNRPSQETVVYVPK